MQVATIKKTIPGGFHIMKPGEMYIFNEALAKAFENRMRYIRTLSNVDLKPIENVLPEFDGNIPCRKVVIVRSGGIGDLLALSSLAKYVHETYGKAIQFRHNRNIILF